jgi:hypothetical protein
VTLTELRALIRLTVADATQWPNATVDAWICAAIRLYSAHNPRRLHTTLTLATDTQTYDLPAGTVTVITVESPAGRTPPEYIPYAHPDSYRFTHGASCYTLRGLADDIDADEDTNHAAIVFAETVTTGETAILEYLGQHTLPSADTDVITVPEHHTEALTAYVTFAAAAQLENEEAAAIGADTITLSQLGETARRAWNRYRDVMDRLSWLGSPRLPSAPPKWERIGL